MVLGTTGRALASYLITCPQSMWSVTQRPFLAVHPLTPPSVDQTSPNNKLGADLTVQLSTQTTAITSPLPFYRPSIIVSPNRNAVDRYVLVPIPRSRKQKPIRI